MCRLPPIRTEVGRRLDDPLTEVLQPQSIDNHTGRQRVVGTDHPFREGQSPLGLGSLCGELNGRPEFRQRRRGHDLLRLGDITTIEAVRRPRIDELPGIGFRLLDQRGEFLRECGAAGL